MRVEFINPFVSAAYQVLEAELGEAPEKGEVKVEESHHTPNDVTAVIGVVGRVSGTVLYSLSEKAAMAMASAMLGQTIPVFDRLVESAVAELGNMISGRASALLEEAGYHCRITPPALIIGKKTIISTFPFQRLVVTLLTRFGEMNIAVALRETKSPVPDHPLGGMVAI